MPLAYVHFLPDRDAWGRPVDPGYGVPGGEYPGQGLPGGGGEHPGQGLPGRPEYPSQRPPWQRPGGERPGQGLPHPGRPVDPGWGVGEEGAGQLPVFPLEPGQGLPGGEHPGQGLPGGEDGAPGHLPSAPPGTIWPPLPPGIGFHGKAALGCYVYYNGQMHHHFTVITIPEVPPGRPGHPTDPDYGVDEGVHPGQGLPGGRPGQPPTAGQPLPRPPMQPPAGGAGGAPPVRPGPGQPPEVDPTRR